MSSSQEIRGPLGLWSFPLLNRLRRLLLLGTSVQSAQEVHWVDYAGRPRVAKREGR